MLYGKYLTKMYREKGIYDVASKSLQTEENNNTLFWYLNRITEHVDMYCYANTLPTGTVMLNVIHLQTNTVRLYIDCRAGGFWLSTNTIDKLKELSGAHYILLRTGKRNTLELTIKRNVLDTLLESFRNL